MKSKLHVVEVADAEQEASLALPEHVQLSLAGIAGQAKEGLLSLAVHTGLAVLHETMEWEVERIVGPKGKHDKECVRASARAIVGTVHVEGRHALEASAGERPIDDLRKSHLLETFEPLCEIGGVGSRAQHRGESPLFVFREIHSRHKST